MVENKERSVLAIIGVVLAILISAVSTFLFIVGIAQLMEDFETVRAVWYIVCSSIALMLMLGVVILCAKKLHVDKLPLIGLSLSVPLLLLGIGLLAFGIVFACFGYEEGIWAIVFGGVSLVASLAILIFSIQKLKKKTQSNKSPVVWLLSTILMLCFSSTVLCFIHFLIGGWLRITLEVICSVLMVASAVGIVLSAVKLKKQSNL